MLGKKMADGKWSFSINIIYFLLIFSLAAHSGSSMGFTTP